jgi:hypothetical protein
MLAITTERLAPAGERVARATGTLAVAAAVVLIACHYPLVARPQ